MGTVSHSSGTAAGAVTGGSPALALSWEAARRNAHGLWLTAIVLAYLVLATAYAVLTPRWQVPDEPAHYNYVASLAATGRLPVLQPGDYPAQYLEQIKAARFRPDLPVDSIRYEAWQPPLYYVLAAAVFKLAGSLSSAGQFLALRLLSVLFGALLLLVADRIVSLVFPGDDLLALATVAFVAFLPMHLTMTAAVNNDTLAELVLALALWLAIGRLYGVVGERRYILLGGALLGLALLAKTTIYAASAAVLLAGETGCAWLSGRYEIKSRVRTLALLFLLGLLVAAWWFIRNGLVYGGLDILAWTRHAQVVTGQTRTAEWIAMFGGAWVAREFLLTSFKSFWGIFGWMGVPMPDRFYVVLALVSLIGAVGAGVWLARVVHGQVKLMPGQRAALLILALPPLLALAAYIAYNLSFVQHQGRYLFPGLISGALLFNLGVRELVGRRLAPLVFGLGYLALLGLAGYSLVHFIVPNLAPPVAGL